MQSIIGPSNLQQHLQGGSRCGGVDEEVLDLLEGAENTDIPDIELLNYMDFLWIVFHLWKICSNIKFQI